MHHPPPDGFGSCLLVHHPGQVARRRGVSQSGSLKGHCSPHAAAEASVIRAAAFCLPFLCKVFSLRLSSLNCSRLDNHSQVRPAEPAMTSKDDSKCPAVPEERRRSPLDQLPPPANSNKPLTPFSIEDILSKPPVRKSYSLSGAAVHLLSSSGEKLPSAGHSLSSRPLLSQTSPLCALEELASKTFKGLEVSVLQAAEGKTRIFFTSMSCFPGA